MNNNTTITLAYITGVGIISGHHSRKPKTTAKKKPLLVGKVMSRARHISLKIHSLDVEAELLMYALRKLDKGTSRNRLLNCFNPHQGLYRGESIFVGNLSPVRGEVVVAQLVAKGRSGVVSDIPAATVSNASSVFSV
jgi:hypothetical protein